MFSDFTAMKITTCSVNQQGEINFSREAAGTTTTYSAEKIFFSYLIEGEKIYDII